MWHSGKGVTAILLGEFLRRHHFRFLFFVLSELNINSDDFLIILYACFISVCSRCFHGRCASYSAETQREKPCVSTTTNTDYTSDTKLVSMDGLRIMTYI